MRLLEPTGGQIQFDGEDITEASRRQMQPLRAHMQMVFQDPFASLNPRKRVDQIVGDAPDASRARRSTVADRGARAARPGRPRPRARQPLPARVLRRPAPADRDRAGAGAGAPPDRCSTSPCPRWTCRCRRRSSTCWTTSRTSLGLTYLFVAHDLSVVRHVSTRIAVMYLGKLMEVSAAEDALHQADPPLHRGAAGRDPDSGSARQPRPLAHHRHGRAAQPDRSPLRLRLPPPLPARDRRLPAGRAAAHAVSRRPSGRLPSPAKGDRRRDERRRALPLEPAQRGRRAARRHGLTRSRLVPESLPLHGFLHGTWRKAPTCDIVCGAYAEVRSGTPCSAGGVRTSRLGGETYAESSRLVPTADHRDRAPRGLGRSEVRPHFPCAR